jgi:hypothetical protein
MPRPLASVSASSAPDVRATVATDGRPIRRHGLVPEDELDVPTWQRRRQEAPVAAPPPARGAARPAPAAGDDGADDDYDIPTFLRRNAGD